MQIIELPYPSDICQLFRPFAAAAQAVLLDSGKPQQQAGRFDIFSAWPVDQLTIDADGIHHLDSDKNDHVLENLSQLISLLVPKAHNDHSNNSDLPFVGGWLGFASYELAYWLEGAAGKASTTCQLPLFYAGYYNWAVIQDHQLQYCRLVYQDDLCPQTRKTISDYLGRDDQHPAFILAQPFQPVIDRAQYQHAFEQIQAYIRAGDCYQVNYALPFVAHCDGDSFTAYRQLRNTVPSPHMAFVNLGPQQLLSISPERFIAGDGRSIHSKPIKGTAARGTDPSSDQAAAQQLQASAKNRAENVMIVDLIRNDFSRHAEPYSVRVDQLCQLESFANVHHLVSTVSATVAQPWSVWDVFFASFPGGSITGAPKIRACQIINELEQKNREIYCGSIFIASDNGFFDSSICIRTLLRQQQQLTAWAGGGIVADSLAEEEYRECHSKISSLLAALWQDNT